MPTRELSRSAGRSESPECAIFAGDSVQFHAGANNPGLSEKRGLMISLAACGGKLLHLDTSGVTTLSGLHQSARDFAGSVIRTHGATIPAGPLGRAPPRRHLEPESATFGQARFTIRGRLGVAHDGKH